MIPKASFRKVLLLILVSSLILFGPSAVWAERIPFREFQIKQQRSSHNGVLVSRPDPVDQSIVDLFYLQRIRSFDDYARWLKKNLTYQKDVFRDTWTEPLEMLKKKHGDCEDFAFLTAEAVRILGHQPHFLALIRKKEAHAILTFQYKDHFIWFDNAKVKKTKAGSLKEFAQRITEQYQYSKLLELDLNTRNWHLLYLRPL